MPQLNFTTALTTIDSAISSEAFDGYGLREIPHELDQMIEDFVEAYLQSVHSDRELLGCLPREAVHVLLAFAERQAALAVRTRSREPLVQSLVAIGLAAEIAEDAREVVSVLPLPWHSAKLLAERPEANFRQASELLSTTGRQALLAFCQRPPEDQTLACMGYVAGSDEAGFRYARTW